MLPLLGTLPSRRVVDSRADTFISKWVGRVRLTSSKPGAAAARVFQKCQTPIWRGLWIRLWKFLSRIGVTQRRALKMALRNTIGGSTTLRRAHGGQPEARERSIMFRRP
eukprot:8914012-Alexandrium_andersonii.AAC.1